MVLLLFQLQNTRDALEGNVQQFTANMKEPKNLSTLKKVIINVLLSSCAAGNLEILILNKKLKKESNNFYNYNNTLNDQNYIFQISFKSLPTSTDASSKFPEDPRCRFTNIQ